MLNDRTCWPYPSSICIVMRTVLLGYHLVSVILRKLVMTAKILPGNSQIWLSIQSLSSSLDLRSINITLIIRQACFVYMQGKEQKLTEMYSLSENMAKKAIKKTSKEFLNFNEEHLSRIYPSASRISSSNYNPAYYWMRGCQMVALNYQTNGKSAHYWTGTLINIS